MDSASIEVNRRSRRAKTGRLDGDKLLAMLIRSGTGERRVWSVVRVPAPEEEDVRRAHRELRRLGHERTAHISRFRGLLVLNNLRVACTRPSAKMGRVGNRGLDPALRAHAVCGDRLDAGADRSSTEQRARQR